MRPYLLDLARILALLVLTIPFGVLAGGDIPPVSIIYITATAPTNLPVTGHYTQSVQITGDFYYAWDWGGPYVAGYENALSNPNITVGYDVFVLDHNSGSSIAQNGTVSVGQTIDLKFNPYVYQNIFWFGTGGVVDSPYGDWIAGGAPPQAATCDYKDYTSSAYVSDSGGERYFDQFVPLSLTPPTRALSNLSGLSCGALTAQGDGSLIATCTVTSTGALAPNFNFGTSYGYFYYRYGGAPSGGTCVGNNYPLANGPQEDSYHPSQHAVQIRPGKQVNIPAFTVNYPLTAVVPNNPPTAPTIGGPTTGLPSTSYTYSFVSTDPDNDQLRYGIDWDFDGAVDQWLPASGYVSSGTSRTQDYSWATVGTKTFRALAQDSNSSSSGWTTYSVTIAAAPADLTAGTISPTTATAGQAVSTSGTVSNGGGTAASNFTSTIEVQGGSSYTTNSITVAASGSNSTSANVTYPSAGTYQVRLCADGASAVTESNEANNCGAWTTVTVAAPPQPDLSTGSVTSPASTATGVAVSIVASVTNGGTASTGAGFTNKAQKATDASGTGATDIATAAMGTLANGASSNTNISYTFPAGDAGTTKYLRVCADSTSAITESNEANNCGAWTAVTLDALPQPDLTASLIGQTSATQNVALNLTATVSNPGAATAGGTFSNTIQISGVTNVAANTITALVASGNAAISANYTFTSTGSYQVRACADLNTSSVGSITESNEANNCSAWQTVTVTAAPQPNLTAGSMTATPTNPVAGVAATIGATVTNTGGATTGAGFTNVFQRATDSSGTGATVIGTHSNATLAAGANNAASVSYAFPSAGTWYVRACADNNSSFVGTITESNEGDNCAPWTAVTVYNVLAVTCSALPTSINTGQNVTWTAYPSGGTGSYTYSWSGTDSLTGSTVSVVKSYVSSGAKTATVTVTSGAQNTGAIACSLNADGNGGTSDGGTVTVTTPLPDLTTGAVTPTAATAGSAVTLQATVTNGGTASTGAAFTDLFQKANDASGTGATDIGTYANATLSNTGGSNTTNAQLSYTFPAGDGGTTKYVRVCADKQSTAGTGVITESDEANNCGAWTAVTVGSAAQPDLTAGTVVPTTVSTSVSTVFSGTVTNGGTAPTGATFNTLFQFDNDVDHTSVTASFATTTAAIANGSSRTAYYTYTMGTAGTWYTRICADNNTSFVGAITESDEANNCGAWTAVTVATAQPNLTTGSVSPTSATTGSSASYSATVTNNGAASTGAGFATLLQKANDASGGGASDVGVSALGVMLSGGTAPTSISYTFPAGDGGTTKYLRVCADKSSGSNLGIITESDENDNCGAWTAIAVSAPAVPTISSCTPSPSAAAPNVDVTWTATVTGFSPSPASYTWNVTGGTPASGSGASSAFTSQFAAPGNYAPTVSATNGTQSAGPFTCSPVTIAGEANTCSDPLTQTITATPTHVTSGGSVTVAWSVTGETAGQTCTVNGVDVGGTSVNTRTTTVSDAQCQITSSASNTVTITNITTQRTYEIDCGGTKKKVVVNVLPNIVEF